MIKPRFVMPGVIASFLIVAFNVCAMAQQSSGRVQALPSYQGWWGFDPDGCFDDEDNQYRVALGRHERISSDKGIEIVFGRGTEGIGMFDGGCDLSDRKASGRTISLRAVCESEGKKTIGVARIVMENEFTLRLFAPILRASGLLLVRCGKLTRRDLAAGARSH